MNVSRILITTASALALVVTIGCSSTKTVSEASPPPVVVQTAPPEPIVIAQSTPSYPTPQSERSAEAVVTNNAPVVTQEPIMARSDTEFTERPPQADRN